MRPALLDPLFAPAEHAAGRRAEERQAVRQAARPAAGRAGRRPAVPSALRRDRPPRAAEDPRRRARRDRRPSKCASSSTARRRARARKAPFKVLVEDDTGDVELVFFLANAEWIKKRLPVGATRWVSGKLELWDGHLQMVHPDRVMDAEELAKMPAVEPVYGLTEGLYPRTVAEGGAGARWRACRVCRNGSTRRRCARLERAGLRRGAAARCIARDARATSTRRARRRRGSPMTNCSPTSSRCCWCARACARSPGRAQIGDGRLAQRVLDALPFALTGAQARAVAEIRADLAAPKRMLRLLQGDVGSGKTVVALLAMAARRRGGTAGGADGADRNPRPPAFRAHAPARRGRRACGSRCSPAATRRPSAARRWPRWRRARSTSPSAPMRCSRRASRSAISASRWSTSSIASACTSASRSPARARRSICW